LESHINSLHFPHPDSRPGALQNSDIEWPNSLVGSYNCQRSRDEDQIDEDRAVFNVLTTKQREEDASCQITCAGQYPQQGMHSDQQPPRNSYIEGPHLPVDLQSFPGPDDDEYNTDGEVFNLLKTTVKKKRGDDTSCQIEYAGQYHTQQIFESHSHARRPSSLDSRYSRLIAVENYDIERPNLLVGLQSFPDPDVSHNETKRGPYNCQISNDEYAFDQDREVFNLLKTAAKKKQRHHETYCQIDYAGQYHNRQDTVDHSSQSEFESHIDALPQSCLDSRQDSDIEWPHLLVDLQSFPDPDVRYNEMKAGHDDYDIQEDKDVFNLLKTVKKKKRGDDPSYQT
jgi:hypothetical protein